MEIPNQAWTAIVTKAGADVQSLYDSATVKQVCASFYVCIRVYFVVKVYNYANFNYRNDIHNGWSGSEESTRT
jgi:hypothetical protein